MWARDWHRFLVLACLFALTSAPANAIAAPGAPEISPATRLRLANAAQDSVLAPWQRDFMLGIARAGVAGAAGSGSADQARSSSPKDLVPADGRWDQVPPPSPRYLHTAVYDPVRDRMVIFGGYAQDHDLVNDVWVLSLAGAPTWTKLTPIGKAPSGRHQHSAIYDPVRDRVVVFGGYDRSTTPALNDTWTLSLAASPRWAQLTPAGTPPKPRFAHSAIYDAQNDRMIVFGGYYYGGYRGMDSAPLNDVWALSLSENPAWTELSPSGAPPIARYAQSAIYDSLQRRMVIYGGFSGGFLDDVWALSLSDSPAWTELTATGAPPAPREYHAAVYDPVGEQMVVFGGIGNGYLGDLWALSLAGAPEWNQLAPTGTQPSARSGHSGIYDPIRHRIVFYGGTLDGFALVGEVWGLSQDGGGTWTNLTPGAPSPSRRGHSAIYDPVRDRMVVFGGYDRGSGFANDVWVLSMTANPAWSLLTPAGTPPSPRGDHSAIYDPLRDRMLVFGGQTGAIGNANDVWALSLAGDPAWTQLDPSGTPPVGREGHSAIYDAANDRMVVFGGISCCAYLSDVWALSLAGDPAWNPITPPGAPPYERAYHSAIYDPVRRRMIVFGGLWGTYSLYSLNDTWELSLVGNPPWTSVTPGGPTPPWSYGHSAIYDPIADRMVVFGGGCGNQAWGLSLTVDPSWGLLATAGAAPDPGDYLSAIYDPVRDRMVIFGGYPFPHDAWELTWGRDLPVAVPASSGGALGPLFAYPNPSRGNVTISFVLPKTSSATLRVFDVAGRVVRTLLNETLPAGPHSAHWDRRTASGAVARPGLYLYELEAGGQRAARTFVLVR